MSRIHNTDFYYLFNKTALYSCTVTVGLFRSIRSACNSYRELPGVMLEHSFVIACYPVIFGDRVVP
jgi:hypothetical protein